MSFPLNTINCNKCFLTIAKDEILYRDYRSITTHESAALSLNKSEISFWLNCKFCKNTVGIRSEHNKTYTFFKTSIIKVTYENF